MGYDKKDDKRMYDAVKEAHALLDDILLDPLVKRVLCNPTPRWLLSGSIVARLDRGEIGGCCEDNRLLTDFPIQRPYHHSGFCRVRPTFSLSTATTGQTDSGSEYAVGTR